MSDIQRWDATDYMRLSDENGYWVTYADHVAAVQAAVERAKREWLMDAFESNDNLDGKRQGQRDALTAAVERLRSQAALGGRVDPDYGDFVIGIDDAEAAIKGDKR
jgi:hypothetical protein